MKILDIIHGAVESAQTLWHGKIEPWLKNFLSSAVHAEIQAVIPLAIGFVQQAVPAAVAAIKSGDFQGYADAQWDAVVNTADAVKAAAIDAGLTSVTTAVNALLVAHPDVLTAVADAKK